MIREVITGKGGSVRLIVPSVHLNGTSRGELQQQYERAYEAVDAAIAALWGTSPNGRDYYVQGSEATSRAQDEHTARLRRLRDVQDEIEAILGDIVLSEGGRS